MFETPQGEVGEFEGPSHEQGGIPLEVGQDVEEGTKVYSDRLKVGGKTLAERKEARERKIANLEKAASDKLVDVATKNALKRRMEAVQKEEASDLQFQEQVNNMQAMADTMVKAFGTGVEGIQKMFNGGTVGEDPITMQQIQTVIGSKPDGTWGRRDRRKARKFIKDKDQTDFPYWVRGGDGITKNQSDMELALGDADFQKDFRKVYFGEPKESLAESEEEPLAEEAGVSTETLIQESIKNADAESDMAFYKPGQVGTPKVNKPGTVFSRTANKIGNSMPTTGDMTKLIGNYLGMTAGMKNAAEQRSTDITHTNVYKDAGKESQKLLDNAKASIEGQKAQAIIKASTTSRGGKKGARGSARGVNQMRAMDWLYDTALNQQIAEISANAAGQLSQIDVQKSGVAINADQLKGQGEYQANMANEAAKDAYYTALGLGKKDFATGMQQTGKDLNDMKENKVIENLMKG